MLQRPDTVKFTIMLLAGLWFGAQAISGGPASHPAAAAERVSPSDVHLSASVRSDRATADGAARLADSPGCPGVDSGGRSGERHVSCADCHTVPFYAESAHGDTLTGVYRLPTFPRGDCMHCHELESPYSVYLLFRPYTTNAEKRALCFHCHDGVNAPLPPIPPAAHDPSAAQCLSTHDLPEPVLEPQA